MRTTKAVFSALLCAIVTSTLSFAVTPDRVAGALNSGKTVAVQKSLHSKALPQYDQGPVDPAFKLSSITMLMTPSPAGQKQMDRLLADQQNPKSANYHKWLTPAQYADRFGLSQNDLQKVVSWLKSQGFAINSIGGGRNAINFRGTALQVQNAFKAEIHQYNVNGELHFANSTPLMMPAALQGIAVGIFGTNDFRAHSSAQSRVGRGPRARSDYYDGNFIFPNFLSPTDVATMYDITAVYNGPPAINGAGETIAIIGETDIFLEDINDFRSAFALPTISTSNCTLNTATSTTAAVITACSDPAFQYILVLPSGGVDPLVPDSLQAGDIGEADLDVEWSGAVAPGAQIVYVNAPAITGAGVFDALTYALNPPSGTAIPAPIVSLSYGFCEFNISSSLEPLLSQGASEGVTIINSSGDTGAAACDVNPPNSPAPFLAAVGGLSVNYPATSPYVTAVGGTSIALADDSVPTQSSFWSTTNGSSGTAGFGGTLQGHIPEIAWNDDEAFYTYCTTITGASPALCSPSPGNPINTTNGPAAAQQDYWISAGGGGASNCFNSTTTSCTSGLPQPAYQSANVTVTNAPPGVRWVPDIAFMASANFPGYIFCTPQNPDAATPTYTSTCVNGISGANGAVEGFNSIVGGTSAAAPVFAGIMALIDEALTGPSSPGLGQVNPMLYQLAVSTAGAASPAFNSSPSGDNIVFCQPNTPAAPAKITGGVCPAGGTMGFTATGAGNSDATTGYNLVTGLGSVDVANFIAAWEATLSPTSLTISTPTTQINLGQSVTFTATLTAATATGNVQFFVNNSTQAIGTVALTSTSGGIATFTTSALPAGNDTVNATYNGDGIHAASSTTTPASVTVIQPSYTIATDASSYTVTQGNSQTVKITLTPTNGFNQNVTYTCTDPASESTCTGPTTAQPYNTVVSFVVTTTAATTGRLNRPFDRGSRIFYAALLPGLMGIVFVAGSRKRSLKGMRVLGLIMVLGASTMWMGSCSSSSSPKGNPGTPKQTYTFTINATTGGTGAITANTTFSLTVQ